MKYPKLPKQLFNINVKITITSDKTGRDGSPLIILNKSFKCNYQSTNVKNSSDIERSKNLKSVIIIPENIFKDNNNPSCGGYIEICGNKENISEISLIRNPDGTVIYTRITTQ